MEISTTLSRKEAVLSFVWQHALLLVSIYLMTLGVVLCIKSDLGSSVISSLPLSLSIAGARGLAPALTVGGYTIVMNFVLVGLQIAVLRSRFNPMQLSQLVIGFVFGWLIDINMMLTDWLECATVISRIATQFAGCAVMGVGIALEVRCGSVTMPGEGFPVALSRVTGVAFPCVKIVVDTVLVVLAVVSSYLFFGRWAWNIVGPGTLFAMIFVGLEIKLLNPYLGWFDRLLSYRPGFRRYIVGLARFIYRRNPKD
ncbi:YczE/YyaS/YitT family protein [Paramuribaculum intestinale]|uniref:YczE/YyaS/YitT family protein n=3 Tax=Paramuribaculum intestinale TaxID=2094151 RepID=UPI0026752236|nr:DUF6198 family protein [Paramuribaculum intestinale]